MEVLKTEVQKSSHYNKKLGVRRHWKFGLLPSGLLDFSLLDFFLLDFQLKSQLIVMTGLLDFRTSAFWTSNSNLSLL